MFSRGCLSGIAEGRENGFAFVPIGKLIGVVAAARLAGLSRGDQHNKMELSQLPGFATKRMAGPWVFVAARML